MARTRPTRRSMTLVAAVVALAAIVHAGPAAAAPVTPLFGGILATVPIEVNGSYVPLPTYCDGDIDVVWYGVGAAPDARWLGLNLAPPTVEFSRVAMSVSGTYRPFVGDFDGDGCEDIFWYSPGAAPDHPGNARRAAATAESTSATVASPRVATTEPSAGLVTSTRAPPPASWRGWRLWQGPLTRA